MSSVWLVFCDCGFHSVCPLMGRAILSKSSIQFSVEGWGCAASLLFDLRPNYGGGNEDNGDLLQKVPSRHCCIHCLRPCSNPLLTHASAGDSWMPEQVWVSLLWGHCSFLLGPGVHKVFLSPPRVCFPSPMSILVALWWG